MNCNFRFSSGVGALALLACLGVSSIASAAFTTYGLTNITHNNAANELAGESQLRVDVIELADPNKVAFKFYHLAGSTTPMSITDVFFDDGTLLDISTIQSSSGVSFSQGGSPPNLPGGNAIGFVTSQGFLADSDPPVQPNGVHPGEWLQVNFRLQSNQTYANVISALALGLSHPGQQMVGGVETLRIGVHVQGFARGGSESFVNGGSIAPVVAPEPGTMAMWALGLALCGSARLWRKRRNKAA